MKDRYSDKVVIITGASAGIGRELALQLSAQRAKVVIAARNQERLNELAESCRSLGAEVLVVATDVGNKEECKRLIETTVEEFGRLDVLINNAGYAVSSDLLELNDITLFDQQMQVNFNGSMYCTYYALPHLVASKGVVSSVSSVAGFVSMGGSSIYNASKYAMRGFFNAIRQEMKEHGVGVTMIYPGYVVTEFMANVQDSSGKERGRDALKFYTSKMMTAARCAEIILKVTANRKRQVVMTSYGKLGVWLYRFFPSMVDNILNSYQKKRRKNVKQHLAE